MTIYLDPVSIADIDRVQKKLAQLAPAAAAAGNIQASNYLVGVLVNREIPPYKYIPRSMVPWASNKQRRFVMMGIRQGWIDVPYIRAGRSTDYGTGGQVMGAGVQGSWMMVVDKETHTTSIVNRKPYARWLYGQVQSRRHALIGWKKISAIINEYEDRIFASFMRGVRKALRDLGLQ